MSFFDSEIVRSEMTEISELQDEVYGKFMHFPYMSDDDLSLIHISEPTRRS